jgi:hypothetical protein
MKNIVTRTDALYKLTMIYIKDIWLFRAFGDEVYTNSYNEAASSSPKNQRKITLKNLKPIPHIWLFLSMRKSYLNYANLFTSVINIDCSG